MSCCPSDSTGYLAPDSTYQHKGKVISSPDAYVTGSGTKAIIMFSDVWGWNSGRVRQLADKYAEEGYLVLVPKILQPALEGGTDGDGLPPGFIPSEGNNFKEIFVPWLQESSSMTKVKALIDACITYIKSQGATSFGAVGFCWGVFAAAHTSAMYPETKCIVGYHPSIGCEGLIGGDPVALTKKISCPTYLAAAGNDSPEEYGPHGSLSKILVENIGEHKAITTRFEDMKHGFVSRGDLADEAVRHDMEDAVKEGLKFVKAFL